MKPEAHSQSLLGITRSKAKMYEYRVPLEHHIEIAREPARLFSISIGLLGDLAALINSGRTANGEAFELARELRFSAQFFDAYLNGRFDQSLNQYLLLVGAASYYLSDLPGSASVLAKMLPDEVQNLDCSRLEHFVAWLLRGDFQEYAAPAGSAFRAEVDAIARWMTEYYRTGNDEGRLDELAEALCRAAYRIGSPRELLFSDVSAAIARKRREHSTWFSLPRYSGQPLAAWRDALQKNTFVRELWPAQRRLGENRILEGKSGVVQMPTSAGKTRATEFIIRSEFLAGRAALAVIVAPFRALCHEIRNSLAEAFRGEAVNVDELSDIFQPDFDVEEFLGGRQILVVTPEKLVYVLRHNPELADNIGLLIYDEGHQFDNGSRGVTYELLVTSLKALIPRRVQTVLISAVISNATAINAWLNGPDSVVVSGSMLSPTFRSIAFASWTRRRGQLQFVSEGNPESEEFFVPRVIEALELERRPRERTTRVFPLQGDGPDVALYLGLKLTRSGSVAIFCGMKPTVTGLCQRAVDVFDRNAPLDRPIEQSDAAEIGRLTFLHSRNLGDDAPTTQSAHLGIFAHHGNTPHGIRLAVEHAMRRGEARMVICTSTLAQGVNLPIRYLIVSSTQQGAERIKVRDFHNLIGRAGRSGMHTEGSIIFANPEIYDGRHSRANRRRWADVKELLQPDMAEPCVSTLLTVFKPLLSDDEQYHITMEPIDLLKACMGRKSDFENFANVFVQRHAAQQFSEAGLRRQIEEKRRIVTAIESYLMAYWDESTEAEPIESLARGTLAYHLAEGNAAEQQQLIDLFKTLADNIAERVPELPRRHVFCANPLRRTRCDRD